MTGQATRKPFVFTGRHMLAIMVAFFGVIISVNLLMAYLASSTWSGLIAKNTYVASQEFNAKQAQARAWLATGIVGELTVSGTAIRYALSHPETGAVKAQVVEAAFRRPVGTRQDFGITLTPDASGIYAASHPVLAGDWIVDLTTIRDGSVLFHEARRINVRDVAP